MNWTRGFFRIWIVLTALWLIAVTAFHYSLIVNPPIYWGGFQLAYERAEPRMLTLYSSEYSDVKAKKAEGLFNEYTIGKESGLPPTSYYCPSTLEHQQCIDRVADHIPKAVALWSATIREKRHEAVTFALETALIPPIAIFLLGAAIRWALIGFRRQNPT